MRRPSPSSSGPASHRWARRLKRRSDWWVLDTETTGLGPGAEVVEVALVAPCGRVVFERLVRPEGACPVAATRVHGLDDTRLSSAPGFREVVADLRRLVVGRLIVAYHAAFDQRVLADCCARNGLSPLAVRWECAEERWAAWRGFRAPLRTACEIEGIATPELHRAAADARLVWELVQVMAER